MQQTVLDDFADLSGWTAITSGQSKLSITRDQGPHGNSMRLDFDFCGGGGFVVARKLFPLELPESYSFSFQIRGDAPSNIFEFKLMDPSDKNVWRYRVESFDFKAEWQPVHIGNNQIEFAWGPLGGGPATTVTAMELVIAAGPGGRGTIWIDSIYYSDDTYRLTPSVKASSALPGYAPDPLFDEAVQFVVESRRASISGVQRRFKIGYNRAARMVEEMERIGLVGPAETNGNREVLAPVPVDD